MTALGLVETKGLLAAVAAADAMLKAADVRLLERSLAGGGLVTITVAGEVAAVKASVDAAAASVSRIQDFALVSCHVIARPDAELARVAATSPHPAPVPAERPAVSLPAPREEEKEGAGHKPRRHTAEQLKKMSLARLRQTAQGVRGLALDKEGIAVAGKEALIEAVITAYRQMEE